LVHYVVRVSEYTGSENRLNLFRTMQEYADMVTEVYRLGRHLFKATPYLPTISSLNLQFYGGDDV